MGVVTAWYSVAYCTAALETVMTECVEWMLERWERERERGGGGGGERVKYRGTLHVVYG